MLGYYLIAVPIGIPIALITIYIRDRWRALRRRNRNLINR